MKIKKIIILILMVMVILGMNITVKAVDTADTYKINLTAKNKTVKQGETITISLNVSDIKIQTGDKGIGAYDGKIEYDKNIFEELKMAGNDNWDKPVENEGIFTSVNSDGLCVQEAQEIAQITLKVKATAKVGSTKVKITDFKASNALTKVPTDDASIEVTVASATNDGNEVGNGTGNGTGNLTQGGGTTNQNQSQIKNNTSVTIKNTPLPKTGISSTLVLVVGIILIIGIFSYIRYKTMF